MFSEQLSNTSTMCLPDLVPSEAGSARLGPAVPPAAEARVGPTEALPALLLRPLLLGLLLRLALPRPEGPPSVPGSRDTAPGVNKSYPRGNTFYAI